MKTKVLQVPLRNNRGGIAKFILDNWRYVNRDCFAFDFITFQDKIDFSHQLLSEGCKIHYVSCYPRDNKKQFYDEINSILDEGYDAIHLHTSCWTGIELEEMAMKRGIPNVIVHSHNTNIDTPVVKNDYHTSIIDRHKSIKEEFISNWKHYATNLCACSYMAAEWLFGDELAKNEVYILKNAIDTDKFTYNEEMRNRYRQKLGVEENFVIGHVGRFDPQKNHKFIIQMFSEVARKLPPAQLLLIGDGQGVDEIKTMTVEYNVADKVHFLGIREDIPELMQAMDVFILPSLFEGLGIVLIEAQAIGLKCIASDKVPVEAHIVTNTQFLPLDKHTWSDELVKSAYSGYIRKDCTPEIKAAGYSIKDSVSKLEQLYRGELRK